MNNRLKALRRATGLSMFDFGKRLELSGSTIKTLESGSRTITNSIINKICIEYLVNEDWFRYGIGDVFSQKRHSPIAMLKSQYSLSDTDESFLHAYVSLPDEKRKIFYEIIKLSL